MSWPAQSGVSRTELDPTSFLHRSATIHPDRTAVVYGEQRRTYAELPERVNRLASALRARAAGPPPRRAGGRGVARRDQRAPERRRDRLHPRALGLARAGRRPRARA